MKRKGGRTPDTTLSASPHLKNFFNTLFSMSVCALAATFGVCPRHPAKTQEVLLCHRVPFTLFYIKFI